MVRFLVAKTYFTVAAAPAKLPKDLYIGSPLILTIDDLCTQYALQIADSQF